MGRELDLVTECLSLSLRRSLRVPSVIRKPVRRQPVQVLRHPAHRHRLNETGMPSQTVVWSLRLTSEPDDLLPRYRVDRARRTLGGSDQQTKNAEKAMTGW